MTSRRNFCIGSVSLAAGARGVAAQHEFTLLTFGDSILDCGHYNPAGVHPAALILRNDDARFPEFRGKDLASRHRARLAHNARDGATVDGLMAQLPGIGRIEAPGAIMLTVGGNDLLRGLSADRGSGMLEFERKLRNFIARLPGLPLFIGNVYDPTFGDDSRNFLGVEAAVARRNHLRVNEVLRNAVPDGGRLVDLHSHFLKGDASWFTHTIEPSLTGASEVRRAFLPHVLQALR